MFDFSILVQFALDGLVNGAMYGLMGMGMALIFGIIGVINLSHGEFFMLGCYIMYFALALLGVPPWIAIGLAAVTLFAFGMVIERGLISPLRRRLGENWLVDGYVLTIGLMIILQNVALIVFGAREQGVAELWPGRISAGEVVIATERVLIFVIALLVVGALALFMRYTNTGRAIRATAEHPNAAQALGIDIRKIYTITFGLGTGLAGAVGALLLTTYPAYPTVGGEILLKSFVVVIIGGLGNVWGAMLAGPLLGLVEAFSVAFATGGWQNTITAAMVLAILVLRPAGLFSRQTSRP